MPPPSPRPAGGLVLRGVLGLSLTLLLLLGLELAARVGVTLTGTRPEERTGVRFPTESYHPFLRTTNPPGPGISTDPEFHGWRILPPDADVEDPAATRILFLGGSTTASRYPEFTVEILGERGLPTLGFNAGAPMHTSLQSLYKLWTYHDWVRPDAVVVLHNVNDLAHGFTSPQHALPEYRPDYSNTTLGQHLVWYPRASDFDGRPVFVARPRVEYADLLDPKDDSPVGLLRTLRSHSTLLRLISLGPGRFQPESATTSVPMPPEVTLRSLPAFRRNLTNLRTSCQALGIPVVFLTMPITVRGQEKVFVTRKQILTNDGETFPVEEDFLAATEAFNGAIRNLAQPEQGAWVLDLAPRITEPRFFRDECHLTVPGLRMEAELVARFLVKQGLVPAAR